MTGKWKNGRKIENRSGKELGGVMDNNFTKLGVVKLSFLLPLGLFI